MDYQLARDRMVDRYIAARGIRNPRVLEAMRAVPRHRFVDAGLGPRAYSDHPLPIGEGQTISQPFIVALMTELLDPAPEDRVLEIGTGSGYQTAVLALLCAQVISVERHAGLAAGARERLAALGLRNVAVHVGDGTQGWPAGGPYDGVLVTAAGPSIPRPLRDQLADGGRLVIPMGGEEVQRLQVLERDGETFREEDAGGCAFVKLIGAHGWGEEAAS